MFTDVALVFTIISGLCWVGVYADIIRTGFKYKTDSMPLFALMLNLGWEALYAIIGMVDWSKGGLMPRANCVVNSIWFFTDILIVYLYIRNRSNLFIDFSKNPKTNKTLNLWYVFIVLIICVGLQIAFFYEFRNYTHYTSDNAKMEYGMAAIYSAFIQNAIMSVLFFMVFYTRKDLAGQNMTLGILKFIGTLFPSILYGILYGIDPLVIATGSVCALFDIAYIVKTIQIKSFFNSNKKFVTKR